MIKGLFLISTLVLAEVSELLVLGELSAVRSRKLDLLTFGFLCVCTAAQTKQAATQAVISLNS